MILLFLLLVFSYLEWKRKKRNRILRVLAVSVALISLYVIYLRPITSVEKPLKSVTLIGENVSESLANYIKKFSEYEVLTWDEETHLLQSKNQKRTYSFNQLDYAIDTLFVRGYVPPINPAYYQHIIFADTLEADYAIEFPEKVYLGDTIPLKIVNNTTETVLLAGMIASDTIKNQTLKAGEELVYKYPPKISGLIKSKVQIDEKENYHFSILVEEKKKYVFHLLAESPDFEWRFLKDFLADEGHAVYLRSKISRNKYKTDFSNWPDSLNQQLKNYNPLYTNVLIADMQAWNNLNTNQKAEYTTKLREKQGVLLLRGNANSTLSLSSIHKGLNGQLKLSDNSEEFEGVQIIGINYLESLKKDEELYFSYSILPDLSLGVLALQDTYKWQLSGKEALYTSYWIDIINKLLRDQAINYINKTKWPVQFQPFHLQYWADNDVDTLSLVNDNSDTTKLSLIQDELYPERQHLVYYPASIGWHQILGNEQTIVDQFYVHPKNTSSQNLMNLSYNYSNNKYIESISSGDRINFSNNKDKSLIFWFFLLFLLSISFLWIEEKI